MRLSALLVLAFAPLFALAADTARLLILHTNDLHDHLRPGAYGQGGLPYVAGYVSQVRAERQDVLVLDAGDVTEKGDMVASRSGHRMTYEAMRRIGYDAVTIGNHDSDADRTAIRRYEEVLGQPLLSLNLTKPDGTPEFQPSRIVRVGALRVGVVGLIVPRKEGGLNFEESGRALHREAERLKQESDLVVALCHEGAERCAAWSRMAPAVDVFVSGHTHEPLPAPVVVPGTGARIVQAGYYARWVGRLDLVLDLERKKVVEATGELVPMKHDIVPVDAGMLAWVRQKEKELCPEASDVLVENSEMLSMPEVAWLGAEALRRQAGTDVGFCHGGQIIRSPIFAGVVDVNALFLAGGDRGDATVRAELSGAEINAYLEALAANKNDLTNWAGFTVALRTNSGGAGKYETNLEPAKRYRVIMPALEWETRFLRIVRQAVDKEPGSPLRARSFAAHAAVESFTGAMRSYVAQITADKKTLKEQAAQLTIAAFRRP